MTSKQKVLLARIHHSEHNCLHPAKMRPELMEDNRAQRVDSLSAAPSDYSRQISADNGRVNYGEPNENNYGPQVVIAAPAASDNENSTNSTWSNSRGSTTTTTTSRRLNLVLPDTKKGTLQTPTIITSEPTNVCLNVIGGPQPAPAQTATSQLLLDSLAQFNGQDGVSLFTGLPSCTPTSADRLTGINPFFWGATAFQAGEHSAATTTSAPANTTISDPQREAAISSDNNNSSKHNNNNSVNGIPNIATNNCPASDNNTFASSDGADDVAGKQAAHRRDQLMVKLAHDHAQAASSNLSPIIFSPLSLFGLSPEQEALIRFGVLSPNQHPLAGRSAAGADLEQLSKQYSAHQVLLQHHHNHHQQQQHHQHHQHLQQTQQQAQSSQLHHYHRDLSTNHNHHHNHHHHQFNTSSPATLPTIYALEPHHQYHQYPGQQEPPPPPPPPPPPAASPPRQAHQGRQSTSPQPQPQQPPVSGQKLAAAPVSSSQQPQSQHPSVLHSPSQHQQGAMIAMHPNSDGQPIGLFEPQIRRIYLQYHHQQQQRQHQQHQQHLDSSKPQVGNTRLGSLPASSGAPANNDNVLSRSTSSSNISAASNIDPLATGSGTCSPIKRHDTISPSPSVRTSLTTDENSATCASTSNNIAPGESALARPEASGKVCNSGPNDANGINTNAGPVDIKSTGELVVKKKSKGGRKKKLVSQEEMIARKNRSKERNRVAAKRCRQKRKQFLDTLRDRIDCLNELNNKLVKENSMLKSELDLLKRQQKS